MRPFASSSLGRASGPSSNDFGRQALETLARLAGLLPSAHLTAAAQAAGSDAYERVAAPNPDLENLTDAREFLEELLRREHAMSVARERGSPEDFQAALDAVRELYDYNLHYDTSPPPRSTRDAIPEGHTRRYVVRPLFLIREFYDLELRLLFRGYVCPECNGRGKIRGKLCGECGPDARRGKGEWNGWLHAGGLKLSATGGMVEPLGELRLQPPDDPDHLAEYER
jgi:hypothetical protein